ncbi:hypothetical protein JKF63_02940 [Porcisia hertigi]|uniref:Uncharacterized protein n=1 Tax=Porcisia hertigi TaxID=2761500 RepID=A0A836HW68_9TRYP|nr:hypothetical protein JKF63_02940 [Porcisia hertigi]
MLHEVYAPRAVEDVAWSRQKTVALSTVIQQTRGRGKDSSEAPHILLLYGPPGCGKLETLKVLLSEETLSDVDPAFTGHSLSRSDAGATLELTQSKNTRFHIFHTCEATVPAYAQYLRSVISYCRGQLTGGELQPPSFTDSSVKSSSSSGGSSLYLRKGFTMSHRLGSPQISTSHAHIIKFYGEPASHTLHRCTLLFLREYEELRLIAQREEQVQEKKLVLCTGARTGVDAGLMPHLRRNPIFFLHTTHDTHNDKVDLNTSFPSTLLQSPAVNLFHCTPITEINLRKRVRNILDLEAQRRRGAVLSSKDGVVDSVAPSLSRAPTSVCTRGAGLHAKTKRRVRDPARRLTALSTASPGADLLDQATLSAIAAGSQGDIRQALLQAQWLCLIPSAGSLAATTRQNSDSVNKSPPQFAQAAATIWERLERRRMAARGGVGLPEVGTAIGRVYSPSLAGEAAAGGSVDASHSTPCASAGTPVSRACTVVHHGGKDEGRQTEEERAREDVEELGSNDSIETIELSSYSSDSSTVFIPKAADEGEVKTQVHRGAAASGKRPRHPSPTPSVRVLSLLDPHEESARVMPGVDTEGTRGARGRPDRGAHRSCAPPATPAESQERSTPVMTRDQYLGLSHAIGRLLTQKYSIDEVLNILNVPPRKILDYLANNQIRYFGEDQLPQYAHCIDAASEADALRASDVSSSFASGPSAAALRERRQLADRTTAGESLGNTGGMLDVLALYLFHGTYRAFQTEVRPPSGFVPQEPPPYLPLAYPRFRDTSYNRAPYSMQTREGRTETNPVTNLDEREWVQQALARLQSVAAVGSGSSSERQHRIWNNRRRRFDPDAAGGSSLLASSTPRIQKDEVDVLREGLPDLPYRCGSTEAVLLDYYAMAPYILLTVDPQQPQWPSCGGGISAADASASLSKAAGATHAISQSSGTQPSLAATPATAPRRTIFRFGSTSPPSLVPAVMKSCPQSAPTRPRRRTCTPLQLAILQRGRDPATAQLRNDLFVLLQDGFGDGTTADDKGNSVEHPLIPDEDDIEDSDND